MPNWTRLGRKANCALASCSSAILLAAAGAAHAAPPSQVAGCAAGAWRVVEFGSSVEQVQAAAESITAGEVYLAVLPDGPFEMLWNDLNVTRVIGRVPASITLNGSSSGTLTEIAPGFVIGVTDRTVMRTTIIAGGQPPIEQTVDDIGPRVDAPPATYECVGGRLETTTSIPGGGVVRLVFEPLP